jgi:signal transduction histidine kinase/HAMP domain-containing protein
MFSNASISSRLYLIVISVNIVILAAITLVTTGSSDATLRTQAIQSFRQASEDVTEQLDTTWGGLLATVEQLSTALSEFEDVTDTTPLRFVLVDVLNAAPTKLIERVALYRPDDAVGVMELQNPTLPEDYLWRFLRRGEIPSNPDVQAVPETGAIHWFRQDVALYDFQQQPTISLAAPYRDQRTGATRFFWVDVDLTTLQDVVINALNEEGSGVSPSGYALLFDAQGVPLVMENVAAILGDADEAAMLMTDALPQWEAALNRATQNEDELFPLENDPLTESETLVSRHISPVNGWRFASSLVISDIQSLTDQLLAPLLISSLLALIALVLILSRFTNRVITMPLRNIGIAAQEIGSGDMRYHIGYQQQQDEIGQLARAMEAMKRNLDHSYTELAKLNRTLEQRVRERTGQLEEARVQATRNATEMREIYDASLLVVNEAQLQPVLGAFIERILALLDATYCAVWLFNAESGRLQLVARNGQTQQQEMQRDGSYVIFEGEGIAGQTIQRSESIIIDDYRSYPHRIQRPGSVAPLVRAISAPLMFDRRPVGVVVVGRGENAAAFDEDDQRILTLFSNQVSPSVRNAQLLVRLNAAVREAERANEVKTRFLASVTHELRTPLNLIINNLDFMSVGAFGDVTPEQHSRLNQTVRSAEHLLYLVNDLLDISKITAGEMQLFIQPNDVYTMLEDSIDNTRALIDKLEDKADKIELSVNVEQGLPQIPMDSRRIRQVLTNLLSNAVKFTHEGSVTFEVYSVDQGVYFAVTDTGIGIPQDEMAALFEAFERTSEAKSQQIEGTGLGLPISQFLVQQHGGEIKVKSTVGQGSTFYFILPYTQPETERGRRKTDTHILAILSSKDQT